MRYDHMIFVTNVPFEHEFGVSNHGLLEIKDPDKISPGEYKINLMAKNKAKVKSKIFTIYLSKTENIPRFKLNFVPQIKNAPKKYFMERIRTEDLKIEMFIADVNSDDGITLLKATLDGKSLTEGQPMPIKV